jgi:hypothetical protein
MSKVSEAEVRAEVRDWLAANWNPDMPLVRPRAYARAGASGRGGIRQRGRCPRR